MLGFTLAICKNEVLIGSDATVLDMDLFSTVQPNLRYCNTNEVSYVMRKDKRNGDLRSLRITFN